MSSSTRTYQAYTMAEALAAVKYDLGADAIILSTRTFKRGGLLGLGRRTVVEVTASSNNPAPASPLIKSGNAPAQRAYATAKAGKPATKETVAARGAAVGALVSEADRQRTRRMAMALQEKHRRTVDVKPTAATAARPQPAIATAAPAQAQAQARAVPASSPLAASVGGPQQTVIPLEPRKQAAVGASASGNPNPLLVTVPATPMSVAAKRFILRTPEAVNRNGGDGSAATGLLPEPVGFAATASIPAPHAAMSVPAPHLTTTPAGIVSIGAPPPAPSPPSYNPPHRAPNAVRPANGHAETNPHVQQELAAIKTMVGQVLQRQTVASRQHTPSMPQKLFEVYLKLVGHDVPDDLADAIVSDMRDRLSAAELENDAALQAAAVDHLADHIAVAPTAFTQTSPNGRPLTLALVGPTGVGKTTTLAKLAASFKLKAGRKVGLITSDTYRIAAVDQLRTYANIIGLPLQVVLTPADMRQAIHALSDCEVILVDTAGRSQNDTLRIAELRQFIEAAHPHEVHLVLSATAGEKVLANEAEAFGRVGVDKLVLTKIDEAASLGAVMNLLRVLGKPVSFITTGQEVPDHIEMAKARRLAELMLGGPVHA